MKKMKWLYVLLATFLLTSCGTLMQPYQMDSKMKDIELGMTKKKVISILGKDFESAGARMTSEGCLLYTSDVADDLIYGRVLPVKFQRRKIG